QVPNEFQDPETAGAKNMLILVVFQAVGGSEVHRIPKMSSGLRAMPLS
ncbi:MAG: hypothetical protein HQK56_20775, partial [Deltaproteobacteria bacterium]|nr:hypothetical protein [Deltaproteobacteria bacterium]